MTHAAAILISIMRDHIYDHDASSRVERCSGRGEHLTWRIYEMQHEMSWKKRE